MRFKNYLFLLFLTLAQQVGLWGQTPDTSRLADIAEARQWVLTALNANDPVECAVWMDSLYRLEDSVHTALDWDERWLLYYWLGNYGNLLGEIAEFDSIRTLQQKRSFRPPDDTLFATIDRLVYPLRFDLFQEINQAFLTDSEKAMATMTLEYLLQLDKTETNWGLKPTNYRTVYPNSRFDRFAVFLRDVTAYTVESPKKAVRSLGKPTWALQLDAGLYGGYWRGYEVERSLNASYAFDLGFTYWRKKHSLAWRIALGGQKIQRDLYEDNEVWYSGSSSNFTVTGLEYGFDVINNQRLRLTPSVGYNASFLFPPIPDEEDVNEPLVSDLFRYNEFHPSIALSLDLKHQPKEKTMVNQSFYHGFKIRGGLRWMQFGKDNPSLEGYQIFFSIGYGIFTYQYPHG